MTTIKNLHLLEPVLIDQQLIKIEAGAKLYKQHTSVIFKVKEIDIEKREVTILAIQEKNYTGKYLSANEIVDKTREYFGQFLTNFSVHCHATEYKRPIVDIVTPEWIEKMMLKNKVRIKDMEIETGIDKTNLSAMVNGKRPLSQITKSMMYFYFNAK